MIRPRWYSGNVDITDRMLRLFGVLSSILVNVKTVQMLFNVVWSFLLTVWTTLRLCAELITRHIKDFSASPFFCVCICWTKSEQTSKHLGPKLVLLLSEKCIIWFQVLILKVSIWNLWWIVKQVFCGRESLKLVSNTKENRTKLLFMLQIRVLDIL